MTAAGATPGGGSAVTLQRTPLGRAPALAELVAALAGSPRPFLLHGRWGRPLGDAPSAPIIVAGVEPDRVLTSAEDPFAALEQLPALEGPVPDGAIGGGIVGWLGFRCAERAERSAGPWPPRPANGAEAQLAWYRDLLRRDEHGQWWVEALLPAADAAQIDAIADGWRARLDATAPSPEGMLGPFSLHRGAAAHRAAVAETIERIGAGELFQANVCLRLDGAVEGERSALVAPVLQQTDPWYGGWIEGDGGRALLSASPELFLRRRGRAVETAPIKGTASRTGPGADPAGDPGAQALLGSVKDRAEHVMILDLMRNDLGRVCDYGSIRAELEPRVEPHAGVWHLVSGVSGTLHDGMGDERLLRATFPPGSVTGAPKVQAMRVIAAVEGSGREAYTGAHGIVSPASGLELAVTIRSLEFDGPQAWLGAGGGIVADSLPEAELQEALRKAGGILAAAGTHVREAVPVAAADGLAGVPWLRSTDRRPDARGGLVETMLVQGGHAEHARAHLQRLTASMGALGFGVPAGDLSARVRAAAAAVGVAPQRLRILVRQDEAGETTTDLQLAPIGATGDDILLRPVIVPGGLGPHKWLDRALLEALAVRLGASPLLLDADGSLLETAWANLWWLDGETLCTPPLDGRQLPGVSRALVLQRGSAAGLAVAERARCWSEELAASPLLLTSARGVTPARLDATPPAVLARAHAAAERLSPLLAATASAGV